MKMAASLADHNGLSKLKLPVEEMVLNMASKNGRQLWFDGDFSGDWIQFSTPIGRWAYIWDDPVAKIEDVYINGEPHLAAARELVHRRGADAFVRSAMEKLTSPDLDAKANQLAGWVEKQTQGWLR
jgi:hypothetical protein